MGKQKERLPTYDTGCEGVADSCFKCPLAVCKFDVSVSGPAQPGAGARRDAALYRDRRAGLGMAALKAKYGIAERTVQRSIERGARIEAGQMSLPSNDDGDDPPVMFIEDWLARNGTDYKPRRPPPPLLSPRRETL